MTVSITFMRYYCTAFELGSISHAAVELNVAASAVSSAIDLIEDRFNLTLVNRYRSRGIQPTNSGKTIYRKFKNLIEEYDHVMSEASDLRDSLSGGLSIGYYAPVAPAFLPRIVKELIAKHCVSVQLIECDNDAVQERYLAGEFDVIFFVSKNSYLQISSDILIEAPPYCLLPADHALARKKSICLKDIADETVIVLNRPTAVEYYKELFAAEGRGDENIIYANSTEMVRSLVGAGLGCAILNMMPATDVSYAGDKLIARAIEGTIPCLTLSIGYDHTKPRRLVNAFVTLCKELIDEKAFTVGSKNYSD